VGVDLIVADREVIADIARGVVDPTRRRGERDGSTAGRITSL
jgi:hypothetical protein